MKVGYVRVSTEEQKTIRQEVIMRELGLKPSTFYRRVRAYEHSDHIDCD